MTIHGQWGHKASPFCPPGMSSVWSRGFHGLVILDRRMERISWEARVPLARNLAEQITRLWRGKDQGRIGEDKGDDLCFHCSGKDANRDSNHPNTGWLQISPNMGTTTNVNLEICCSLHFMLLSWHYNIKTNIVTLPPDFKICEKCFFKIGANMTNLIDNFRLGIKSEM